MYAPLASLLEGVRNTQYGNSYVDASGPGQMTRFFQLFAQRKHMKPGQTAGSPSPTSGASWTDYGVSGTDLIQVCQRIAATWTPNDTGLVSLCETINTIVHGLSTASARAALRSALAYLTAWAQVSTSNFVFGPAFSNGVATAGAGAYVDIPFAGDAAWILIQAGDGTGGATGTIKRSDGTTAATFDSTGYDTLNGGFPLAVKLSGLGTGAHTVRLTATAGTVTVLGALIPAPQTATTGPPSIIWFREGSIPNGTY